MSRSVGQEIIAGMEEFANALEANENIPEIFTSRKIALELRPQPYSPDLVKATRRILGTSQAVFAQFLGVSVKTVSSWEQGKNVPQDVACRMMDEIRHDPSYWRKRLRELAVPRNTGRRSRSRA